MDREDWIISRQMDLEDEGMEEMQAFEQACEDWLDMAIAKADDLRDRMRDEGW